MSGMVNSGLSFLANQAHAARGNVHGGSKNGERTGGRSTVAQLGVAGILGDVVHREARSADVRRGGGAHQVGGEALNEIGVEAGQ